MAAIPNCTNLLSLGDFNKYIEHLRTETNFITENLTLCREDICNAIWGTGNPDISGIGVRIFTLSPSWLQINSLTMTDFNRLYLTDYTWIWTCGNSHDYSNETRTKMGVFTICYIGWLGGIFRLCNLLCAVHTNCIHRRAGQQGL